MKIQCIVVCKLICRISWGKTGLLAFNVEEVHQLFSDGRRVIGSERDFLSTLFPSNLVKLKYYIFCYVPHGRTDWCRVNFELICTKRHSESTAGLYELFERM